MVRFQQYYLGYRRIGFSRLDAFRFAWMVVAAGVRPIPIRSTTHRWPNERY